MNSWTVQDAQSRFNKLLNACATEGPQLLTKHGTAAAVMVSIEQWQRLTAPSLKQLLLSEFGRSGLDVPTRGQSRHRPLPPI